nr:MAG TPA: hypothetical protein [Microviridae sp.]
MKKNYYRLVDANFYCVATYYGTKSNANDQKHRAYEKKLLSFGRC